MVGSPRPVASPAGRPITENWSCTNGGLQLPVADLASLEVTPRITQSFVGEHSGRAD